jgi:hypothetical protein
MFDPENIIFVARSSRGSTICSPLADVQNYVSRLKFRGVGEVWAHTSTVTISKWINSFATDRFKFDARARPERLAEIILGLSK